MQSKQLWPNHSSQTFQHNLWRNWNENSKVNAWLCCPQWLGGGKILSIRYTQMALTVFSKLFVFKESYLCFFPEIKTKVQSFYLLINSLDNTFSFQKKKKSWRKFLNQCQTYSKIWGTFLSKCEHLHCGCVTLLAIFSDLKMQW